MVDMNVCILSHLKEELAWATDKWLRVISTISYSSKELKGTKEESHFKFKTIMFALLCGP